MMLTTMTIHSTTGCVAITPGKFHNVFISITPGMKRTTFRSKVMIMEFNAFPETKSQGLFHQIHKEVTFCGLLHGANA